MRKANWKEEGGQIFGAGSQTTIAVFVGVKDTAHTGPAQIHYRDIGDYLDREQKLRIIDAGTVDTLEWDTIVPNTSGDWVGQRDDMFGAWPVIAERRKPTRGGVFTRFSRGVESARDAWMYSYSRDALTANVRRMVGNYNALHEPFAAFCESRSIRRPKEADVTAFLTAHPEFAREDVMKWSASLKQHLARGTRTHFDSMSIAKGSYRPFDQQYVYFNKMLNHRQGELPSMFPTPYHRNYGIVLTAPASHFDFTPFITDLLPNLHLLDTGQFFPRYAFERVDASEVGELDLGSTADISELDGWGYRRVDNITDEILGIYRTALDDSVTKDQIFWSVYGQLHVRAYRETYAADLKKMLPHIPTPESLERFTQLADAGEQLGGLHMRYEDVDPYPLDVEIRAGVDEHDRETWRVQKMKWRTKDDHTAIVYNPKVTIAGIPPEAEKYLLGSRSALAWIIDRYQIKTDKASGIVNDPNLWCDEHDDPTYIVELIKKVTTVSVRTVEIVKSLDARGVG